MLCLVAQPSLRALLVFFFLAPLSVPEVGVTSVAAAKSDLARARAPRSPALRERTMDVGKPNM